MLPESPVQADTCAECGQPIPADARTFGLCPRCLIRSAIAAPDGSDADGHAGSSSAPRPPDPPGPAELAAEFVDLEILELIGRGGMGMVYKARQVSLDRPVALKLFPVDAAADPAFAERFRLEARVLASLGHPNVVTAHQFGQTARYCYLVMEYVAGANLRDVLRDGPLAPDAALRIGMQVCDALDYAHGRGVVHRDIKPENILLDRPPAGGDVGRVRVADFGLAKLTADRSPWAGLTVTGQRLGTPHYAAPEQTRPPTRGAADDGAAADARSDLYSVGVVLYEMLTGTLPLGRFPTPSQKARVDARLDVIVLRCLDADPSLRYQRASELRAALAAVLAAPVLPLGGMPMPHVPPVQAGLGPPLPPMPAGPPLPIAGMPMLPSGFGPPLVPGAGSPLAYEPVPSGSSRRGIVLLLLATAAVVILLAVPLLGFYVLARRSAMRTQAVMASTRAATPAPLAPPPTAKRPVIPSPPNFPGPAGFPGGPFPPRMAPSEYLQQMIRQHGADRVVTIRIDGLTGDVRNAVVERLQTASGAGSYFTSGSGDSLTVHLAPVSDVKALAGKIDFGQVKQIDAGKRTIDVRADPARLPAPLKPEVKDPQDPAFYARNLEDLSAWDRNRRRAAALNLRDAPPGGNRGEIARALAARLRTDADRMVRLEAAAALATWAMPETVPALIGAFKDADSGVQRKAMETLAKVKDPRAAGPLAACLKTDRFHAADCLRRFGPGAEEAVLPYLDDDDGWVRLEAAKVLQEIGTVRSLPALRQAAEGHDGLLPGAAKQAAKAIEQRGETPGAP